MGTIGRSITVAVGTDGISYTDVGHLTSADMDSGIDLADDTTNDSAGDKANCYADAQSTFNLTYKLSESDGGQDALRTEYFTNRTGLYIRYRPLGDGVGNDEYICQCKIESLSTPTTTGDTIESNCSLQSHGAITYQQQSA